LKQTLKKMVETGTQRGFLEKLWLRLEGAGLASIIRAIAGVVQWQNGSFPSFIRGFDSLYPLQIVILQRVITPQNPRIS
jgi:hypothetical protein